MISYFIRMSVIAAAVSVSFFLSLTNAKADDYPSKPVRIVIGFAPGGGVDILGRMIAQHLTDKLGTSFFVENRPGANANIAADAVSRARPDGYNLLMVTSSHALSALTATDLKFDPVTSFTPITLVASLPNAVIVGRNVPVNNLQEFIDLLHKEPGKYSYASTGVGGSTHLSGEAFKLAAKVEMLHVPYGGASQALNAVLAGDVSAYFGTVASAKVFAENGMLKILAISSKERSPDVPQVPTTAEAGLPGYESASWYALMGPKDLPPEITHKIRDEVANALKSDDIQARLKADGGTAIGDQPEEFGPFLKTEIENLKPVVKAANIKAN